MKSLEWYQGKIQEMMENDKESYAIFDAVDKMFHGDIQLPPELKQLDDIRLIKDSSPHDALYNATVALANSRIALEMIPLGANEDEFERANRIEEVLTWNWQRANMRGASRKIWSLAHSALRYDLAISRVDDLYFYLPRNKENWSKANKRAARAGRFVLTVLPPHKVHFQNSELAGVFCVVSARNLPLTKVIEYYESIAGDDDVGKKILATVSDLKKEYEDGDDREQARFMLYQYTDDSCRLDYGHITDETEEETTGGADDDYVFIHTENKIPFVNYTIRGGASDVEPDPEYQFHPMLASAHWNELWKNSVLTKSLVFSDILRRLREIRGTYEGAAADMVSPDDGTGGDKPLPPGTTYRRLDPTTLDPQAIGLVDGIASDLAATTSASALGNLSRYSNTAFSTMNAIVQVEMGKLNPQRNIIQDSITDQCMLFLEWADFTGEPLQAWRTDSAKVGAREKPKGEEIRIEPKDYDLDRLFLSCTITPETPTDQMQQMNIVEKLVQMGMSAQEGLERMNVPHSDLQRDLRGEELLKDGALQALIQKITRLQVGEAELQIHAAMAKIDQQIQQQAQQAQAQQMQGQGALPPGAAGVPPGSPGMPSPAPEGNPAFEGMRGEGMNPAAGGMPPMEGAPGMGREQMMGMTENGQDMGV